MFKADAKTASLQESVGDQKLHCEPVAELSPALGLEHHQCLKTTRISVRSTRCTKRVVGQSRAIAYVEHFLSADGLSALAGGREIYDSDHWNTARSHNAVFKSCRVVIKVVGKVSHCRSPSAVRDKMIT